MKLSTAQHQLRESLGLVDWRMRSASTEESEQGVATDDRTAMDAVSIAAGSKSSPPTDGFSTGNDSDSAQQRVALEQDAAVVLRDGPLDELATERFKPETLNSSSAQADHEPRPGREPCWIIWGAPSGPIKQRLEADLALLFERYGLPWQSFEEQAGFDLPPPPALCFILTDGVIRIDEQGRLLLPARPELKPALDWKPQLWAYLQTYLG